MMKTSSLGNIIYASNNSRYIEILKNESPDLWGMVDLLTWAPVQIQKYQATVGPLMISRIRESVHPDFLRPCFSSFMARKAFLERDSNPQDVLCITQWEDLKAEWKSVQALPEEELEGNLPDNYARIIRSNKPNFAHLIEALLVCHGIVPTLLGSDKIHLRGADGEENIVEVHYNNSSGEPRSCIVDRTTTQDDGNLLTINQPGGGSITLNKSRILNPEVLGLEGYQASRDVCIHDIGVNKIIAIEGAYESRGETIGGWLGCAPLVIIIVGGMLGGWSLDFFSGKGWFQVLYTVVGGAIVYFIFFCLMLWVGSMISRLLWEPKPPAETVPPE